uniref:Cullin-1-like n=1 Tax=Populus alba TaxID=43335 RepID=A0A4U5QS54_POPAL|nr:cullin-1-like [Populus alba]
MDADMMLNEKLKKIDDVITKKKMIMDGHPVIPFTPAEKMIAYEYPAIWFTYMSKCVYNLCTRKLRDSCSLVYEKYTNCFSEIIQERVLPVLMDKHGTELLTEITRLWLEYKELLKSCADLDNFYIRRKRHPSPADSMRYYFCNLVCDELFSKLQEAMMRLIIQEREGGQIDRNLLKRVLDFFLEAGGNGTTDYYEKLEQIMLAEAAAYYSQLSLEWWFWGDSLSNYLRKVDRCLNQEEARAEFYLSQTTKTKLLDVQCSVMKYVLLERNAKKWAQKQNADGMEAEDQELLSKYASLKLE